MRTTPEEILERLHSAVTKADKKEIKIWLNKLADAKTVACENSNIVPPVISFAIETIINNTSENKYLFSILLTCCIKKLLSPSQDIRIGQDNMSGGYSNRSFDQRFVTPFLKRYGYTHCEASGLESGRNFERPHPWDLKYAANPRGRGNRESFLGILNYIEDEDGETETVAKYLLWYDLSKHTTFNKAKVPPLEKQISKIIRVLTRHFTESSGQGKSRLPVLALYATYEQLVVELDRYQGMALQPLARHTTADLRSGSIGDIQINCIDEPFEGVEVKSERPITAAMVNELPRKFNKRKIARYYILSTSNPYIKNEDQKSVDLAVHEVESITGAQIICNGLIRTLWYYLRLLKEPSKILTKYQALLESDEDIRPELKEAWNSVISEEYPDDNQQP
jgi:DNA (cytosine-5)-methyltransferase 1